MQRGRQVFVRAIAGLGLLIVVGCGGSNAPVAAPSTGAQTPAVETTVVDTTVVDTTAPATTSSTTTPATTTTERSTTTTIAEPTTTTVPAPVIDPNCPTTPHGAVIDRDRQRAWLCDNGVALPEFVITTAVTQPVPGTYPIYAKSMRASSTFGGHYSTMTHFVAFTRGIKTGARVAFHTVPVLRNGDYAQPLESVGTPERHGDSAGCIRVLPEQGQVVWDWLQKGDEVRVIT
jgi:L,D-transpeptidase catalytic domain